MDNEKEDFSSKFKKTYVLGARDEGIHRIGDYLLNKVKATYRIGTSKNPISPKIYKNWGGEGRGKIKTRKINFWEKSIRMGPKYI